MVKIKFLPFSLSSEEFALATKFAAIMGATFSSGLVYLAVTAWLTNRRQTALIAVCQRVIADYAEALALAVANEDKLKVKSSPLRLISSFTKQARIDFYNALCAKGDNADQEDLLRRLKVLDLELEEQKAIVETKRKEHAAMEKVLSRQFVGAIVSIWEASKEAAAAENNPLLCVETDDTVDDIEANKTGDDTEAIKAKVDLVVAETVASNDKNNTDAHRAGLSAALTTLCLLFFNNYPGDLL
jgi:hypothetical protein